MFGAREATEGTVFAPLRRLIGRAMARDLRVLVVPGPDVALARGLDLEAAGLRLAANPREANVLLLIGPLGMQLRDAASVAYAQMPRPRAILALGVSEVEPLPEADVRADLSQDDLRAAVSDLRGLFANGAFAPMTEEFSAPALQSRIEYTCPMHPEVVSDEPGSCPKCGMFLVPRETDAGSAHDHAAMASAMPFTSEPHHHAHGQTVSAVYSCPMHPEVTSAEPGSCPKCGMTLVAASDGAAVGHHHGQPTPSYSCPMHPEVTSDEPGSCPKCGMTLVAAEPDVDGGHDHSAHGGHVQHDSDDLPEGIEPGFMSMVEMTEGTPRSSDGLQMEWIKAPFGPFFPGLPGGLTLLLTLDGDTVVAAETGTRAGLADPLQHGPLTPDDYVAQIGAGMPLAPVSYQLLACRAIEAATGTAPGEETERGRDAALARERIASHLVWLAQLGRQLGLPRIQRAAEAFALTLRHADRPEILRQAPDLRRLIGRTRATPFLTRRLAQVGELGADADWIGPTTAEPAAAGRLVARLDEIADSLGEIDAATALVVPVPAPIGDASGHGHASVRTPRGIATLHVTLEAGKVARATLDTPSSHHVGLVGPLTEQRELADALVAVASLDLDPWEIDA